jgi:hypothetical protein
LNSYLFFAGDFAEVARQRRFARDVTFQGVKTKSAHINGTDGDIRVYTFSWHHKANEGASLLAKASLVSKSGDCQNAFASSSLHRGIIEADLRLADDIPRMQPAFFLRGFFPPPAAFAFVLVRQDRAGAGSQPMLMKPRSCRLLYGSSSMRM